MKKTFLIVFLSVILLGCYIYNDLKPTFMSIVENLNNRNAYINALIENDLDKAESIAQNMNK